MIKYNKHTKNIIDFVLAFIMIIFLVPFFLVIAILIRIDSSGPVFFRQNRLGKNAKVFKIFKFRTMTNKMRAYEDSEVLPGHSEVTRVGKILRRIKIDELPQLFNVILGHMSLVGPRPAMEEQLAEYSSLALERLKVKPGMTGLAQIQGGINLTWPDRWLIDVEYVNNISFYGDVTIILETIFVLLFGKNFFKRVPVQESKETKSTR